MNKHIKSLVVLALIVAILLPTALAQGQAEKKDKITIGVSWNEQIHSLIQAWQDYMEQYGKEYGDKYGIEIEWVINVAGGDPTQQASNIEDLINQGVDVIVARAHDAAAIGASITAAHEAGIPFITFDRESSSVRPDAHVGADSFTQAVTTGEAFAALLEENGVEGKCIELQGDLRDMNAVNRSNGWHAVEDAQGVWETVVQIPTEWNPEKFLSGATNALEAHPEANCMFVASDFAFEGVVTALENAGKLHPAGEEGHIWIAAQDVNPQGYDAMLAGYIDVATTYDAYFHAVELVHTAVRLAEGDPIGATKILVPGRVATADTVAEMEYIWARDYED
jgi:ABC-type sugar transport system substrate-binding protein